MNSIPRNYFFVLFILCLFIFGCNTLTINLSNKWRPLKTVVENPIQSKGLDTTIGDTIYTRDVLEWKYTFPEGSHIRNAHLIHERVHSWRQGKIGLTTYLAKYTVSRSFRWNEEKLAVYASLKYYKKHGIKPNLYNKAYFLAGRTYYKMVSIEEAYQWIQDAWNGKWKPKAGDLPPEVE